MYRKDTVTKTNDGGLANLKKECKVVWVFPSENVTKCPVHIVDKYVSLLPPVGKSKKCHFYLWALEKPNPAQWYGDQPVGRNTSVKVVGKLLKSANLDGYFTNHSLRRTSATQLFQGGIDGKIVKEVTGHVSDAVNKYQIMSNVQCEQVSNVLKGPIMKELVNDNDEFEEKKKPPPIPSLEVSVTNRPSGTSPLRCSCKRQRFDLEKAESLNAMINVLVSKCSSGRAKIKLEIEFTD